MSSNIPTLRDSDKQAIKQGAKTACNKFLVFVDKFTELIFIVGLLTGCGLKMWWTFGLTDPDLKSYIKFTMVLTSFYQVVFAIILFLSMRDHPAVKYHLGFLNGALSKAFFLLFASLMVFPLSYTRTEGNEEGKGFEGLLLTGSYILVGISVV